MPALGRAIARNLLGGPCFKTYFDGFPPAHARAGARLAGDGQARCRGRELQRPRPELLPRQLPTFAVGAAAEYGNADEGWGIPVVPAFQGKVDLSRHLVESLEQDHFDITSCQEMLVDHAFTLPLPLPLLWLGREA